MKFQNDFIEYTTVQLDGGSDVTFYEDFPKNFAFNGAYMIWETELKGVDFFILGPKNEVLFSKMKKTHSTFNLLTQNEGTYSFVISNIRDSKQKTFRFAIDTNFKETSIT